jgi:2-keto-4-pentenoate hydratase/2-oxohepta-3-ene-1,7-dioic acid hydratase in catechol pathway
MRWVRRNRHFLASGQEKPVNCGNYPVNYHYIDEVTEMKLGTFRRTDRQFVGLVREDRVFELKQVVKLDPEIEAEAYTDLRRLMQKIGWDDLQQALQQAKLYSGYRLDELETLAPVTTPGKIICIGLNYRDHAAETQMQLPAEPVFFSKFNTAIIGPGQAISIPSVTRQVDYEAELAIIIGKRGKAVPVEQAGDLIAGYTVFNDVSARDLQFRDGGQWIKGKSLDTFAPIGPYLVTTDEVPDPDNLTIRLWVNGQLLQDSNTGQMIFSLPMLVSYLSQLVTLEPGDLIATGTPPGVGYTRKPPVFLKDGDQVTIAIEGVGRLSNPVIER